MIDTAEGRWEEAKEHLEHAIALGTESRIVLPLAHQWLAEREILEGDPAAARTRLEPLAVDQSMWTLMMLPTLGWAQVESGEIAAADALVTRLVTDTSVQMPIMVTEALRVQGMVRYRQGRKEEARSAFDQAISLARRMEYPHAGGCALYEWGHLSAQGGEREAAGEQLMAALGIFRQLGAHPDIDRAEQALAALTPGGGGAHLPPHFHHDQNEHEHHPDG
jgi:tetratricopeptide (TPR) repeat protein